MVVRRVLRWAMKHAEAASVDMLDIAKSWARAPADRSFDDVVGAIDERAAGYFSFSLRGGTLELFIRGVEISGREYFIFVQLNQKYLGKLKQLCKL
jgi:hypothetical protein